MIPYKPTGDADIVCTGPRSDRHAQQWWSMSSAERWEFLMITDLLSRRTFMYNDLITTIKYAPG